MTDERVGNTKGDAYFYEVTDTSISLPNIVTEITEQNELTDTNHIKIAFPMCFGRTIQVPRYEAAKKNEKRLTVNNIMHNQTKIIFSASDPPMVELVLSADKPRGLWFQSQPSPTRTVGEKEKESGTQQTQSPSKKGRGDTSQLQTPISTAPSTQTHTNAPRGQFTINTLMDDALERGRLATDDMFDQMNTNPGDLDLGTLAVNSPQTHEDSSL